MLEYSKLILEKVAFDHHLFEKELRKAINLLMQDDAIQLNQWCSAKFNHKYDYIISSCFQDADIDLVN